MISVSKSGLLTYLNCPYAFYLYKIKKIKGTTSPAMFKGSEIHKIFEDFYKQFDLKNIKETLSKKQQELTKHKQHIDNFIKFNLEKLEMINDEKDFLPVMTEKTIVVPWNKNIELKGIIDRVDAVNGKLIVIDYKTGKVHDVNEYKLELSFYDYLLQQLGLNVSYWGIYFSKENDLQLIDADKKYFMEEIVPIIKELERDYLHNDWEKTYKCTWCNYREWCKKNKYI